MALKLLILEDDESLLNSLRGIYELLNYSVFTARRGDEALAIISKERPHVVLCDLHLEDSSITGIEVLKQTSQKYPEIKVIVASGYGKDDSIVNVCSQYKPFMFMDKPIDFDKLSDILQKLSDNLK